jgi:hypothetical protein
MGIEESFRLCDCPLSAPFWTDMRRLAKQSRQDTYASRRDYQDISAQQGITLSGSRPLKVISFAKHIGESASGFAALGGYIWPMGECRLTVTATEGANCLVRRFDLHPTWNRFGVAFAHTASGNVSFTLQFEPAIPRADVWGLAAGIVALPAGFGNPEKLRERLSESHLIPETFYLSHTADIGLGLLDEAITPSRGQYAIRLKKCSYCGRLLPLDPKRPSALAFHKHNDKKSGHQNECRACKKWRINDSFNPKRTPDQFHESSTINRERALFLREPAILQAIKDRDGDGLKSIVWKRFGKKCFKCGRHLKLDEVELDHTRPFAYLWPIDEHATCLCGECNNHKKDRFPAEFYSPQELRALARIVGLPLGELVQRTVCEPELRRIIRNIAHFADTWDPRTFNAVARKVSEIEADTDLFEILKDANLAAYARLLKRLKDRPPPVVDAAF